VAGQAKGYDGLGLAHTGSQAMDYNALRYHLELNFAAETARFLRRGVQGRWVDVAHLSQFPVPQAGIDPLPRGVIFHWIGPERGHIRPETVQALKLLAQGKPDVAFIAVHRIESAAALLAVDSIHQSFSTLTGNTWLIDVAHLPAAGGGAVVCDFVGEQAQVGAETVRMESARAFFEQVFPLSSRPIACGIEVTALLSAPVAEVSGIALIVQRAKG